MKTNLVYLLFLLISTVLAKGPLVEGDNDYFGNMYVFYTWTSTFYLCSFWGLMWIIFTGDRGFAYSSCINSFQTYFAMNQYGF